MRSLQISKKPSLLAEPDGVGDSLLQRPAAPPQLPQLVGRHRSMVVHVDDAVPANRRTSYASAFLSSSI